MIFNLEEISTRPVFVIATQRSGTNLLRKSLAQTNLFCDLNEVFDPYHNGYWEYRTQRISENPTLSNPTEENQVELWHGFLQQKLLPIDERFTLIDVKYNSAHHLDTVWRDHGQMPFFLRWLATNRFPVIHIVRENVLDTYVSNLLACKLKVWVADDPSIADDVSFKLAPVETVAEVNRRHNEIQFFRKQFVGSQCMEIAFDSIVTDNRDEISRALLGRLYSFLQIPNDDRIPTLSVGTKKMGRSAKELVENFDAVHSLLNLNAGMNVTPQTKVG